MCSNGVSRPVPTPLPAGPAPGEGLVGRRDAPFEHLFLKFLERVLYLRTRVRSNVCSSPAPGPATGCVGTGTHDRPRRSTRGRDRPGGSPMSTLSLSPSFRTEVRRPVVSTRVRLTRRGRLVFLGAFLALALGLMVAFGGFATATLDRGTPTRSASCRCSPATPSTASPPRWRHRARSARRCTGSSSSTASTGPRSSPDSVWPCRPSEPRPAPSSGRPARSLPVSAALLTSVSLADATGPPRTSLRGHN